ncbi:hypothetical protein ACWGQ2_04615 [Arthrobacter sp. NPDC055585]
MGEFIIFLVVAAAGFAVGRLTSRKGAGASSGYPYGSGLPHPARIFEEGYEAGRREAALAQQGARSAGAGTNSSDTPGAFLPPPAPPAQPYPRQHRPQPLPPQPLPGGLLPPGPLPETRRPSQPSAETPQRAAQGQAPAHPAPPQHPTPDAPAQLPGHPLLPAAAGPGAPRPENPVPAVPGAGDHPRAVPPAAAPRTAAELAAEKRRRDLRNINITLYSGSLLLVAAAALFIGISIPEQARFAGVALMTALFYASGLVIHSRKKSLRPAAVAFTGTGLALIPVVGLAFYNLILPDPVLAWLATSLAGTAAFAYAAARLESRVVTYLALTFLLSTALASGASLRSGILWYFISTVLLATLISLAAVRRPGWLRNIYLEAFVASHRFLVPATAAAAVLTAAELGPGSLAVLFLAIAAYYGVLVWQGPRNQTLLHTYGLRAAGAAGMVFLVFHAADSWPAALLAAVIITGIQVPALNAGSGRYLRMAARADLPGAAQAGDPRTGGATRGPGQRGARIYVADLLTVTGLQFVAGLAAAVAYALNAQNGTGTPLLFAATATVVQLTLCTVAWRLSQHAEYVAPAGVLLPAVACLLTGTAELWPVLVNLGILTAFFVLRAARSQGSGRAAFVLAARASAAVGLPLTVFALLQNAAPENAMAWTLAAAFLAAAANQAWTVLAEATGRRELFPRAVPAVFASAALLCAAALRFEEFPSTALALTALWTVVLLNAVYSALPVDRGRGKTAVAYAPAGFLFAGVLGAGLLGVRGYELLCTAALAYCALQSFKPAVPRLRGWYFAAGQVLLTVLAGLVTHDLGLGPHKVFAVVAAALAVQLAARTVLGARLEGFGPVHGLRWGTLLALAATAPAYYLVLSPETEQQTGSMLLLIAAAGAVLTQVAAALRRAPAEALRSEPAAAAALVFLLCAGMRVVEGQTTTLTLAVLWVAFAANLTTAALHRYGVLAFLAPGGFLAAMLLGTGILGLRGYELLLAAALAYCAAMVRDRASRARGIYLAGAQGAGAVLAALLAADVSGHSTAVFFAALGIALAAGQILRTVLHRRVHPLGSAEPLRWGGLVALVLVPVVYMQFGGTEPAALLITVLSAAAAFTAAQLDAARRTFRKAALPNTAELVLAAAVAVLLAVPAVRLIEGPYAAWALGLLWLGLGANIAASLLLGPGRWEALAAGGFAGAALTGAGLLGLRGYELLVLAALACALFLARLRQPRRGQYLLAAQLLTAVLAVLLAADAGADIHGVVAAGAAAGAAAQLARTVLEPRQAGPWARAALWTSMGLLVFAPVLYAALAPGEIQRDVTALLLLLLLAVSAAGYARTTRAAALYPGLYALGALPLVLSDVLRFGIGGLLPDPAVPVVAAGLVLAALAAAALTGEARARDASLRTALLGACVAYCAAVPAAAAASGGNLLLAALAPAVLSAGALTVSHSRGIPWLAAGTPPLLFGAAALAAAGFEQEILPRPFPPGYELLWTVWATALVLQAVRLLLSLGENASPLRLRILGAASSLILLTGAVPAMAEYNSSAVAGSLTLLAALALAVRETPQTSRETAIEAGCLLAALAVERIVWFVLGGAGWFWSVQYWAVVLAALAGWEYLRRRQVRGTVLLGAAAVILSGSGLITAVSGGTGEQLWALVAHAGLLVFGLLASRKLFTIWGASGVALAVLWYLRGYTFLLLALLAAGLIALAVWRLSRVRTAAEQESEEVLEER